MSFAQYRRVHGNTVICKCKGKQATLSPILDSKLKFQNIEFFPGKLENEIFRETIEKSSFRLAGQAQGIQLLYRTA